MTESPQDFDQPVNAKRLARLFDEQGGGREGENGSPDGVPPVPALGEQPINAPALCEEQVVQKTAIKKATIDRPPVQKLGAENLTDDSAPAGVLDIGSEAAPATTASPRHQIEEWLAGMVKAQASDLILRAGARPSRRVSGKIHFLPGRVPGPGPLLEVLEGVMGSKRMDTWRETGSVDAALHLDGLGRFRLNAYKQMGEPAVVIRRINDEAPDISELGLPMDELKKLAMRKRGLMLVTGIAGSGKSTTLGGMIQHMNTTVERHIVTLEDPVELIFKEQRCVISQREIGTDCMDFQDGLRHALRQSPDVILIGEMRDAETVISALDATETGHLVLSTLHTVNAAQTVDRILSFFAPEQHQQVRSRLSDNLAGVLSQRLLPESNGEGMVPAFELLVSTPHVRELLAEGNTAELCRVIEQGSEDGLISFNECLRNLVVNHRVELQEALASSDRPDELVLALRGITASHGRPTGGVTGGIKQPTGTRKKPPLDEGGAGLRMAGGS
ncbi:MAG: twitching motility protein PilT [Planctomycetota bacterium]|jgi:twitching motility protein PilT